jgi:hypothetical protein
MGFLGDFSTIDNIPGSGLGIDIYAATLDCT